MRIIFEDNHLIAVYKPSELLTQPSPTCIDSLETQLKCYLKERDNKPGQVFVHPIHRLDKPVSGLVLFAKTSKALSRLQKMMREGEIRRFYRANVAKALPKTQDTLTHWIIKKSHHAQIVTEKIDGAKLAHLKYQAVSQSEVEIELITGRYHQIRAQLSAVGSPIIGDKKYGGQKSPTLALYCSKLIFRHPVTQKEQILQFEGH